MITDVSPKPAILPEDQDLQDVAALWRRVNLKDDFAAQAAIRENDRSVDRQQQAGFSIGSPSLLADHALTKEDERRGTDANGKALNAAMNSLAVNQITQMTADLTENLMLLSQNLSDLNDQQRALMQAHQAVGSEITATQNVLAKATEGLSQAEIDLAQAQELRDASALAITTLEDELCTTPDGEITLDSILANDAPAEALQQLEDARLAQEAAQQDYNTAAYKQYGESRLASDAAVKIDSLTEDQAQIEGNLTDIAADIKATEEEITATEAKLSRLEDPEVLAAIERGDYSAATAVANISSVTVTTITSTAAPTVAAPKSAADGSNLALTPAADSVDGPAITTKVPMASSFDTARIGIAPTPDKPSISPDGPATRQTQELAMNRFAPQGYTAAM